MEGNKVTVVVGVLANLQVPAEIEEETEGKTDERDADV